jgi:hypothetical protein
MRHHVADMHETWKEQSPCSTPSPMPGVKTFVQEAIANLEMAHDAIIESRVVQTYHTNKK